VPGKFGRFLVTSIAIAGALLLSACGSNSSGSGGNGGGGGAKLTVGGLAVFPGSATIPVSVNGGQPSIAQFTAYLGSAVTSATWSVLSGTGTISSSGVFTAPGSAETDTIQAVSGSNSSVPITINVVASSRTVVVTPAAAAVPAGATLQLTTAAGCAGTIWQVNLNGNSGNPGTITNGTTANGNTCGLYTAPVAPPASGTVTITASSGGSSGTSTVTILFSNASLNSLVNEANPQPYAFSYLGDDSSGFLSVAGTFTADGNGNITGGTEDVNSGFAAPTMTTFGAGGTYTVGPDGRTTANLNVGGSTDVLQFALISNQHALMIRFDTTATGSGTIDMQDPTQFGTPFSLGAYSFGLSGLAQKGAHLGMAGRVVANNENTFPLNNGIVDVNDGGTLSTDMQLQGGFSVADPATGRGTLSLNCPAFDTDFGENGGGTAGTLTFVYYVVDATHVKVLEGDTDTLLAGDFYGAPASSLNMTGSQVFVVSGSDNGGNPYGMGGAFLIGSGGVLDLNDNGNLTSPPTSSTNITTPNIASATASPPATNTGRIGLSITVANNKSFSFAAYLFNYITLDGSPSTGAVLLETDTSVGVGTGLAYTQTGATTPQGSFALNLTGVNLSSAGEQDIEGQISAGNLGALTGTLDINNIASNGKLISGEPLTSASAMPASGLNGRGNPLILAGASQTDTLSYYVIDDSTALVLETDSSRALTGKMARQF
jgi:hypothetical protein